MKALIFEILFTFKAFSRYFSLIQNYFVSRVQLSKSTDGKKFWNSSARNFCLLHCFMWFISLILLIRIIVYYDITVLNHASYMTAEVWICQMCPSLSFFFKNDLQSYWDNEKNLFSLIFRDEHIIKEECVSPLSFYGLGDIMSQEWPSSVYELQRQVQLADKSFSCPPHLLIKNKIP